MDFTSRSEIESDVCPRKRYLSYRALGTGLIHPSSPVDLVVGSAVHKGCEGVLSGLTIEQSLNDALQIVRESPELQTSNRIPIDEREDVEMLVYILVSAFHQTFRENILTDYDVISIEQERPVLLTEHITLNSRADAILREKDTGLDLAFSLKTCGKYATWLALRDQMCFQNYTEPFAYGVNGVQMLYLVKGLKRRNPNEFLFHGNPFLYPWHKDGEYSWSWNYRNPRTGTKSTLGSSWTKVKIWDHMSMPEWLGYINERRNDPMSNPWHSEPALEGMVIVPPKVVVPQSEIERVIGSLKHTESQVFLNLREVERDPMLLDSLFPRRFTECADLKGICPYYECCRYGHDPQTMVQMGFTPRVNHHQPIEEEIS